MKPGYAELLLKTMLAESNLFRAFDLARQPDKQSTFKAEFSGGEPITLEKLKRYYDQLRMKTHEHVSVEDFTGKFTDEADTEGGIKRVPVGVAVHPDDAQALNQHIKDRHPCSMSSLQVLVDDSVKKGTALTFYDRHTFRYYVNDYATKQAWEHLRSLPNEVKAVKVEKSYVFGYDATDLPPASECAGPVCVQLQPSLTRQQRRSAKAAAYQARKHVARSVKNHRRKERQGRT